MNFPLPPDCPYYLISRASLSVTSVLKKGLVRTGVSNIKPAYLGVLLSLWSEDNLRTSELGRRAGLEPSSMTGLLDRMERDRLLKRTPDPMDRRGSKICLTKLGIEAEKGSIKAVEALLDKVFADIPKKDIETTKNVLRKILANCSREDI